MRELREIIKALGETAEPAVLATVVDLKGSSYRLPGARMLVLPDGSFVGTVSGGCLEADVLERAERVRSTGNAEIFLYDTASDENSVFSLNMGCKGIVRILLERVGSDSEYVAFLRSAVSERKTGFVAASLETGSGSSLSRAYFDSSGVVVSGEPPEEVADEVRRLAEDIRGRRPAGIFTRPDGAEYFIETVTPPVHLAVFGAGADAIPLIDLAARIGWETTVVDHRPAYANEERFPSAGRLVVTRPEDVRDRVALSGECAAVVMSHNFNHDKEYLRHLLRSGAGYLGALGPRVRTAGLLEELEEEGEEISAAVRERLHAPVGLDIDAADPETIAVSIIAEIQAALSNRSGGPLRRRDGSIYEH